MIQRAEAGMPNAAAIVIRVAVDVINETDMKEKVVWNSHISHQAGALFSASLAHTMEFTNWLRQANAVHIM